MWTGGLPYITLYMNHTWISVWNSWRSLRKYEWRYIYTKIWYHKNSKNIKISYHTLFIIYLRNLFRHILSKQVFEMSMLVFPLVQNPSLPTSRSFPKWYVDLLIRITVRTLGPCSKCGICTPAANGKVLSCNNLYHLLQYSQRWPRHGRLQKWDHCALERTRLWSPQ